MEFVPGFTVDRDVLGSEGGSVAGGRPRGVVHTTEGPWDASLGVFRSKRYAPHFMVEFESRRRHQFIPLGRSSYALEHVTCETNRWGPAYQIEIIGHAAEAPSWSGEKLDWLGSEVLGPISEATGIELVAEHCYGEGEIGILASSSSRARMTCDRWLAFTGWCGHQHIPGNSHWDPGGLDLERVVRAASGPTFDLRALLPVIQAAGNPAEEETEMTRLVHVKGKPGPAAIVTFGTENSKAPHGVTVNVRLPDTTSWREIRELRSGGLVNRTGIPELVVSQRAYDSIIAAAG